MMYATKSMKGSGGGGGGRGGRRGRGAAKRGGGVRVARAPAGGGPGAVSNNGTTATLKDTPGAGPGSLLAAKELQRAEAEIGRIENRMQSRFTNATLERELETRYNAALNREAAAADRLLSYYGNVKHRGKPIRKPGGGGTRYTEGRVDAAANIAEARLAQQAGPRGGGRGR